MSSSSLSQTDANDDSLARRQNSASSESTVTKTSVPSGISTCSRSSILPSLMMALIVFNMALYLTSISAYPLIDLLATSKRLTTKIRRRGNGNAGNHANCAARPLKKPSLEIGSCKHTLIGALYKRGHSTGFTTRPPLLLYAAIATNSYPKPFARFHKFVTIRSRCFSASARPLSSSYSCPFFTRL